MAGTAAEPPGTTERPTEPPRGWGADELTGFIDDARQNQWATFANKPGPTKKLIAIDAQFAKVSKGWLNPQNEITVLLLLRCHSSFRTSAVLAMAGQLSETHVQCRAMLECAAYAVHIHRNPGFDIVWLDRHGSPESMEMQRTGFSHRKVLTSVMASAAVRNGNL